MSGGGDRTPALSTRVVVLDPIHDDALAALRERFTVDVKVGLEPNEVRTAIQPAEVVVLRSGVQLDRAAIEGASNLRVICRAGAGIDNIDLDAAAERSVVVFRIPSASSVSVAEFCFGLILSLGRKIALADAQIRRGEWRKPELAGIELSGKALGLVGVGRIGGRIAGIARGFSMSVYGTARDLSPDRRLKMESKGIRLMPVDELLEVADFVCLALPLTASTAGLIGIEQLRRMKSGALLINISREGIVVEEDLVTALAEGLIGGAAVDVPERICDRSRLSRFENVVLTPHIGAMTSDAQRRIGKSIVENLDLALSGADVPGRVC